MGNDLAHSLRSLLRAPGYAVTAILVLALGIAGAASIFSVVNATLLRPLPFKDPDRLAFVWETNPSGRKTNVVNPINFAEWRSRNHSFDGMAAYIEMPVGLAGKGDPEQVYLMYTTRDFFSVLGVSPAIGRTFTDEETTSGGPDAALITHRLWVRRFGGDPGVVGQKLLVDGSPIPVVGVLPANFRYPNSQADLFVGYGINPKKAAGRFLRVVARMKPGVGLEQARADMSVVCEDVRRIRPEYNAKWGVYVQDMSEGVVGKLRTPLLILFGAVGFVLLIACANIANLTLVRAVGRSRELAVRASMGAGTWRIARLLLAESLMLAVLGGGIGIAMSAWGIDALVASLPDEIALNRVAAITVDWRVVLFSAAVSIGCGIAFALAPALRMSRIDLNKALRDGSRTVGDRGRMRSVLVVAEVALSVVLLAGAGLMARTMMNLYSTPPGYDLSGTVTMHVSPVGKTEEQVAFAQRMLERVRNMPSVQAAGTAHFLPLTGMISATGFWRDDRPKPPAGDTPATLVTVITPGYMAAMGVPLLRGRAFDERDRKDAMPAVIVNQTLVKEYFPNEDPLGHKLAIQWGPKPYTIVGISADVKYEGMTEERKPAVYLSYLQDPGGPLNLVVRTAMDPTAAAQGIIREIHGVDSTVAVSDVRTMRDWLSASVAPQRFESVLLGAFAALALALAAIGVFGVLAYNVSQRTREIGVRVALGAQRGAVAGLIVRQALALVLGGVLIGAVAALALTRLLEQSLFGVRPADPLTYVAVFLVLATAGTLAVAIPARRALGVDPAVALRYE